MPRKYTKKRTYKRKGYHPYIKASAPAVGYVAMKAAKIVAKKYLNTELKYYDLDQATPTGDSITLTGGVVHLNPISVGDTSYQRDGNQCKMKSIDLNYIVTLNGSATQDATIKVMLCKMNKGNGSLPTYNDFFDSTVSSGASIDSFNRVNAFRQKDNTQNMMILQSHKFTLAVEGGRGKKIAKSFHQPLNAISRWAEDTTAGDIGNAEQNIYFLMYIADQASDVPFIKFVSRVKFLDN